MTAQQHLKAALRDGLGPLLRAYGYKGSAPTWTRVNDLGDTAVVNVQSSSWSTASNVRCVINLAVTTELWLEWSSVRMGQPRRRSVKEYDGLWRDRLHRAGAASTASPDPWWMVADEASAEQCVTEMRGELERHGLPTLTRLLDRAQLLDTVRRGDLGFAKERFGLTTLFTWAEAVLLADRGHSSDLDRLLRALDADEGEHSEQSRALATWLRHRSTSSRVE